MVTKTSLNAIAGFTVDAANANSLLASLDKYGRQFGLDKPHRLAHYIAQVMHESGRLKYDEEIASGAAYEGRKDLGNTQPGDGKKFKGRGPVQITGRANYRAFTKWCRKFLGDCPDFEKNPHRVNEDPYEGLGPIWYWDEGNPDPKGYSLNVYADKNNIEMITRRINGGLNGFQDRIELYDRTALVMLGYSIGKSKAAMKKVLTAFQTDAKQRGDYKASVDGQSGPATRTAFHIALMSKTGAQFEPDTAVAPITEEKEVVPPSVDKEVKGGTSWYSWLTGGLTAAGSVGAFVADMPWTTVLAFAGAGLVAVVVLLLLRRQLIAALKEVRAELQ